VSHSQANIFQQVLQSIGLNQAAIDLYLHLLADSKHHQYLPGSGGVKIKLNISHSALELGFNRSLIYDALKELEIFDLIEYLSGNKNQFILHSIEAVKTKLLQKQSQTKHLVNSFDEFLPDILNQYSSLSNKSYVTKFDGRYSFIHYLVSLASTIENDTKLEVFAEGQDMLDKDMLNYLFGPWLKMRLHKNITSKVLLQQNNAVILPWLPKKEKMKWEPKYLPQNVDARGCFWVTGNTLIHFDTALNRVISIQDRSLATLHSQLFQMVWAI